MTPMLERTNKSIEFFVIGGILLSRVIELFTEKAIGLPSLLRTPPNSKLEASQSTSNTLEKSGSIRIGASVTFCLRSSKLFWASSVHLNVPPLRHFVMGAIMVLKPLMK
jgi:hypothetical protein